MTDQISTFESRLVSLEQSVESLRDELLPPATPIDNATVKDEHLATAGWLRWQSISVHNRYGYYLLRGGQEFKATRIKVFASDIHYNIDPAYPAFTTTGGIGGTDPRYRYSRALRYGIVLFQKNGTVQNVLATSAGDAPEFSLENTRRIYLNVNDGNSDAAYGDNHGSFDINIVVIDP